MPWGHLPLSGTCESAIRSWLLPRAAMRHRTTTTVFHFQSHSSFLQMLSVVVNGGNYESTSLSQESKSLRQGSGRAGRAHPVLSPEVSTSFSNTWLRCHLSVKPSLTFLDNLVTSFSVIPWQIVMPSYCRYLLFLPAASLTVSFSCK